MGLDRMRDCDCGCRGVRAVQSTDPRLGEAGPDNRYCRRRVDYPTIHLSSMWQEISRLLRVSSRRSRRFPQSAWLGSRSLPFLRNKSGGALCTSARALGRWSGFRVASTRFPTADLSRTTANGKTEIEPGMSRFGRSHRKAAPASRSPSGSEAITGN